MLSNKQDALQQKRAAQVSDSFLFFSRDQLKRKVQTAKQESTILTKL